ncbi:MerR family transcriptional regulator [Rugosimonospora africana]|uniref:HTH-type transcriptional activator TipA n=1 Tax=Rugosimonospora africana TaxID=556532 RepID=A0A8J3QP19_9ACTN|nr:MerR family transcriptional regulator [Rugosimonospora africana]GIH13729.1 HTH-type transcriptional activator TipA [Rugosimonospora africana]
MDYSVGQVARYAGISVRTLHHYHEIGLLTPRGRTATGYRRYGGSDLERLQQVLFYRELGFPLEEIAAILDDPGTDAQAHLRRQHTLLNKRIDRLRTMVTAVERAMEAEKMGVSLTPEERFEVFGENDPAQYADEVEQRWGETDAYKQSQERMKSYTKDDWVTIKAEGEEATRRFAEAMASGEPAAGQSAMDAAEAHRQHIERWFYDVPYAMHRCLAEMYVADPRFTANYEEVAPGLAQYVRDAILANADRHEA